MTDNDSLKAADEIIEALKAHGDYSNYREQIATELYEEGIWNGNWDSSTELVDPVLKDIRLIQEDEYDQSMDEDEKPDWDDMISQVDGGYLFFA